MAVRTIKGTCVRNPWDFYEQSDYWMFIQINPTSTATFIYLENNSPGLGALDVYRAEVNCDVGSNFSWVAQPPNGQLGSNVAVFSDQCALQVDLGAPIGKGAAALNSGSAGFRFYRTRVGLPLIDDIELKNGGPLITIAPGWRFGVVVFPRSSTNYNVCFWYQLILDQVVPA